MGKGIVGRSMVIDHFGTNGPDTYVEKEQEERRNALGDWHGGDYTNQERWAVYRQVMYEAGDYEIVYTDVRKPPRWFGPHIDIPGYDHFNYESDDPKRIKAEATKPKRKGRPSELFRSTGSQDDLDWKESAAQGGQYAVRTDGNGTVTYHFRRNL